MIFRYIGKQIRRSAVAHILFCLLLAFSGILLCLGVGVWAAAIRNIDEDEHFITIAVPNWRGIYSYSRGMPRTMLSYEHEGVLHVRNEGLENDGTVSIRLDSWGNPIYEYDPFFDSELPAILYQKILQEMNEKIFSVLPSSADTTADFSDMARMDARRLFGGSAEGVTPVLNHSDFVNTANALFPQSSVAIIAECTKIELAFGRTYVGQPDSSTLKQYANLTFSIKEPLIIHPGYPTPRGVLNNLTYVSNPDGSIPFEVGKSYLLIGNSYRYQPPNRESGVPSMNFMMSGYRQQVLTVFDSSDDLRQYMRNRGFSNIISSSITYPATLYSYVPMEGNIWSSTGMYEYSGSIEDMLTSENGEYIQKMIEHVEKNINALQVFTTNDVYSIFGFNQNRLSVSRGRVFDADEVESGSRVCLISERLAEQNNLRVGDTLSLNIYNTYFGSSIQSTNANSISGGYTYYGGYNSESPDSELIEYTVVGIYEERLNTMDFNWLSPNTIIVPDSSIDRSAWIPYSDSELLYTVYMPNGKTDEFRALLEGLDTEFKNFIQIYDRGFEAIEKAVNNIRRNAVLILGLCAAGWVAGAAVFVLFYVMKKQRESGLLAALGVSKRSRFLWVFLHCFVLIFVSQLIVFGVSGRLYDLVLILAYQAATQERSVQNEFFSDSVTDVNAGIAFESIPASPYAIPFAIAVQSAVLLVAVGIIAYKISRKGVVVKTE